MTPLIIIPTRMAATRLPGKPLADINGQPMILRCWRKAVAAAAGPVLVATADMEIAEVIHRAGGQAVLTKPDHPSGSDRVYEAAQLFDPQQKFDVLVNLQGDMPAPRPEMIHEVLTPLANPDVDIATLAARCDDGAGAQDPAVVKAVAGFADDDKAARALTFTRAPAPYGDGPLYHHIGIYAYRRAALRRFIALPQGVLERRESLEQLRALEHGMRIDVALTASAPISIDTPADLRRARQLITD